MEALRSRIVSSIHTIKTLYKTLSPERVIILWLLFILSVISLFATLLAINIRFTSVIPTLGGTVHEGIVGTPRFINPVLATSDQDIDMVSLLFAGLTKRDSKGNLILDMAESITESDDKLHYTIILKPHLQFHDGTSMTADDFIYTISLIQNPNI